MTHTYKLTGMHCESCVTKVRNALAALPDVEKAEVTLNPMQAAVTMKKHIQTDVLNKAVQGAGKYSLEEEHSQMHSEEVLNPFASQEEKITFWTYKPLILIFLYLIGLTAMGEINRGSFNLMHSMNHFMGGFFLFFSFFKLLNLTGFAEAYSTYDIIAKKWNAYGFIYPFIELALGIGYLFGYFPVTINIITLAVMSVSSIGVIQSVLNKSKIRCACLGTIFNLPMTTITIVEDLLMAAMAIVMLIILN
jgi:cation transport ATPase